MSDFKTIKVKEIGRVITGNTPPTINRDYYGDKYIFIKPTDMRVGERFVLQTEERLSELAFKRYRKALIPPFSTCVVTIGSLGKKLCLTHNYSFTNQAINSILPNTNFDNKFIYYLFKYINPAIENLSNGTASGRDNVSKSSFENLNIIVPKSKQYQKVISTVLSSYDELIEVNSERIKLLEETVSQLYKEWFVRMRFPGYKTAKFKKGIPVGWKVQELQSFGKIYTGKTPPTKIRGYYGGNIPFIKTPDLHNHLFILTTEENLTEKGNDTQKRSTLPKGSICVSCIGTGGIVSITTAEKSQTNQQINSLVPDDRKNLEFLFHRIKDLKETIELFGGTGATMTNLSKGKFEKLKIIYPNYYLVEKYSLLANPIFEQIKNLLQQNLHLQQIRDRLLPRLISGKLQVKDLRVETDSEEILNIAAEPEPSYN